MTERRTGYSTGRLPVTPPITVVVTEVDNTLYDWMAMWSPAFGGMLARLAAQSGVPVDTLEDEFRALHQRHGTTEYAFAIQELPSLMALHPGEDLVARYAAARRRSGPVLLGPPLIVAMGQTAW